MQPLICPVNLEELYKVFSQYSSQRKHLLAGGTDWLIKYRGSLAEHDVVIDISKINELRGISLKNDVLYIGAMETMTSVSENEAVKKYASALADAASVMGSRQIRNRATLGGNVANASPAADTPSAFAALSAVVVIDSPKGSRRLSVEEVITGANRNSLLADEFIRGFEIKADSGRISAFKKIGSRSQVSISRINMALSAEFREGAMLTARVYVGTLGSAAKRCPKAEASLCRADSAFIDALALFVEEMIPGRSTLPYKRSAVMALGEDLLSCLALRAKGGTL